MKDKINKLKESLNTNIAKCLISIIMLLYLIILNFYFTLPVYSYYSIMVVFAILGIWMLLPKIVDIFFLVIVSFGYSLYVLAQIVYYRGFSSYFYLRYGISMRKEVVGVISSVFELIKPFDYMMLVLLIIVLVIRVYLRSITMKNKTNHRINLVVALLFLITATISALLFQHNLASEKFDSFLYNESDRYIYETVPSTEVYVKTFGINAFLIHDLYATLLEDKLNNYDEKVAAIDSYLLEKSNDNNTNEYTGVFRDMNLVIIQGESLTNLGIDPILTPTLYEMYISGLNFTKFSAPLLPGSTSDTEIMVQNSLYPLTDGYATMHAYADNAYPLTLAKVFKEAEYKADIYHNNYGTYYNRNVFYANDAYDHFFEPVELGLDNMCSDLTMLSYSSWIVAEKEKFYSYFITYSGHQPYNFISTKDLTMAESAYQEYMEYVELIDETYPGLDEFTRAYLAKSISLDRGVRDLLIALDVYGKLDDTVIVLFGDHYIKGYEAKEHQESLDILGSHDVSVPLIIYNRAVTRKEINKFCNSLDLLPTLLNMFDLEYDVKKAFGYDIFDEDYIGYYFDINGTIKSENFIYDYVSGLSVYNDMSEEEAQAWIESFEEIKQISSYIIETDYFSTK